MKISKKLIYTCATAFAAVLSVGCSQSDADNDEPDNPDVPSGVEVPVRISLSARPNNGTRGDGDPKDPIATVELIHDWWIAFVAKNGDVKVIKRDEVDEKDRTTSTSVNIGDGFEAETFKTTLPSGKYRIYAFANIEPVTAEYFKNNYLNEPEEEGDEWKHKDLHLDKFNTNDKSNIADIFIKGMQWPSSNNIPMSGVMTDIIISNTIEEALNIEVVRTVAKVEFAFSNPSADNITLENLNFGPISNLPSKISIIPNYKAIGEKVNDKLKKDDVTAETLSLDLNSVQLTTNKNHSFSFYCNESLSKDANGDLSTNGNGFEIELKVIRNGENKEYTYQTKKITYINRNDWIHIPIKFNDWIVEWKLHFYPPIGGYPPVFSQSGSGNNITATVTTGGEFELYPSKIMRNGETTDYKESVNWTVYDQAESPTDEPTEEQTKAIQVKVLSGSDDIFVTGKEPKVIDNPNKSSDTNYNHSLKEFPKLIIGEIDPKKPGTAKVQIKFYLNNKDSANKDIQYADTEFTCTFTINYQIPIGS